MPMNLLRTVLLLMPSVPELRIDRLVAVYIAGANAKTVQETPCPS